MQHRWLLALWLLAACASRSSLPIPQRPAAPPLDGSFFASTSDPSRPKMRVHLIDVGQGAATLVEFSCGAILIDTGGESNRRVDGTQNLMTYLHAFFESRPDLDNTLALLVLTHPHIDHTRGARVVMGELNVQHLVTDGLTISSGGREQQSALRMAKARNLPSEVIRAASVPAGGLTSAVIDPVACSDGDPDIRVLWGAVDKSSIGWSSDAVDNENNESVVVRIKLGEASLLVTGDLEQEAITSLVAKHRGTDALSAQVYQVGHHGSFNGTTKELLGAVSPKIALVSCGPYERKVTWSAWAYGHPRAVTIDLLEHQLGNAPRRAPQVVAIAAGAKQFDGREMTAPIYATAWDSDVIVTLFADGVTEVRTRAGHAGDEVR